MEVVGAVTAEDIFRLLAFFSAIAFSFWQGRKYERVKQEMEDEW